MIAGVFLLIGGVVHTLLGRYADVSPLTVLGGLWLVCGAVNVAWSRAERRAAERRARDESPIAIDTESGGESNPLTDPLARARTYRATRGAPIRGLITLACAAAAVVIGIRGAVAKVADLAPSLAAGTASSFDAWPIVTIVLGAILGFLALLGLLVYGVSGVERSATIPATATIVGYRDTGIRNGNSLPLARFTLTIHAQGLTAYQAVVSASVPVLAARNLAVGARFPALAAGPAKPNNVIVDWSKPLGSSGGRLSMTSPKPADPLPTTIPGADLPAAPAPADPASRLRELDALAAQQLISPEEYRAQRARILDAL